jgi:ribonuclease BN (tRNA processing enzyme)
MDAKGSRVVLLGTGAEAPTDRRRLAASVLVCPKQTILIDCGSGSQMRLKQSGLSAASISLIVITHVHTSHYSELRDIALAAERRGCPLPLPILFPRGGCSAMSKVLSPQASATDLGSPPIPEVELHEIDPGVAVVRGTRIQSAVVAHNCPGLAYRFETPEGTVVFSGDTEPCDSVVELSRNADLLVHECSFPDGHGKQPWHTTPTQLGLVAARAQVRHLAMNHFFPSCDDLREAMIDNVAKQFKGDILFGEDLMSLGIG